jgi:hypothetical protein
VDRGARVERSLDQRAVGYERDAVKIFCSKDGKITKVPYREHVPPDVTACIFWLKNRDPARIGNLILADPAPDPNDQSIASHLNFLANPLLRVWR